MLTLIVFISTSLICAMKVPQSQQSRMKSDLKSKVSFSIPFLISTIASPSISKAFDLDLFPSESQQSVSNVAAYRKQVKDLLYMLKPNPQINAVGVSANIQLLKDTKEDSDVVSNYMEQVIKPLQMKMTIAAPKLKLDEENQKRVEILPALMKGHILELTQAISQISAKEQLKEVEEVEETLEEFLTLASSKYKVPDFIPTKPLGDKELFGPLGCEFYGKKRVEGSNACEAIEKNK